MLYGIPHAETDFSVPGGFNVTIMFAGVSERRPFPLNISDDIVSEGDEVIELLIMTPGNLDGVIPGFNNTATIVIVDDDCKCLI